MSFFEKLGEVAKTVTEKANDSIEINKLNSDISIAKTNIQGFHRRLGEYYWSRFVVGERLDDEAMAICDEIVGTQDKIRELEKQIAQIHVEREEERQGREEAKRIAKEETRLAEEEARLAEEEARLAEQEIRLAEHKAKLAMDKFRGDAAQENTAEGCEAKGLLDEKTGMEKYCGNCGGALGGQRFCTFCGQPAE